MAEKPANIGAYKNMNTAKKDMSPSFLKATEKDKQKAAAKDELSANENAITGADIGQASEGIDGAAETEENASSNFINNVSGRGDEKGKGKGKGKGFFSKKGPITLILILTLGMGGLTLGGQMMQPFALVSNIIQNFDSASYSTTARLNTTLKAALKGARNGVDKVKLSDELEASLKLSGIDAEADDDGNLTALNYQSKDGSSHRVSIENTEAEIENAFKDTEFSGKIANSGEMVENSSFYTSKAKDYAADRIGWVKNRWDEFDSGGKNKTEMEVEFKNVADNPDSVKMQDVEQEYKSDTGEKDDNGDAIITNTKKVVDDNGKVGYVDDNGNIYDNGVKTNPETPGSARKLDVDNIQKEMDGIAKAKSSTEVESGIDFESVAETAKKAGSAVSAAACVYSAVATSVAAVTIAQQVVEMINIASGYMEAVQKVQAGDGDGSSLHMYNNETNQTDENGQGFWSSISISSLFGGKTSGQSAGLANVENIVTQGALSSQGELSGLGAGLSINSWRTCTYSKLATNLIDFGLDIASLFTFGLTELIKVGISVVASGVIATVVSVVIGHLTEIAIEIAKTDVIENMGSIFAGDYTVGGGNYILKQTGRSIGLSAGTPEATESFARYSETVIAARASYDRDNLSPLDITNRNTFLGSIVYSFTQFAVLNSGNPMNRTLSAVGSVLSSAASSFTPMTSASVYSNIASKNGGEELCPLVSSTYATASANHCFDYAISDTRTFDITYEDAKEYLCGTRDLNCTDEKAPQIRQDSDLYKYITLWTHRDTHLGLPDASATSHKLETGNTSIDGALGAVPVLGAITDITNATVDANNEGYIFGSAFVVGHENTGVDSTQQWNERKQYIQAFLELDTVYEELALTDTPVVATFLDNYYAENPIDQSYEGILARISGLPKEEVVSTLAYIDYLESVANYNPSNRYSFIKELEVKFLKDVRKTKSNIAVQLRNIAYYDIRNRNFVI